MNNSGISFTILSVTAISTLVTLYYIVMLIKEVFKKERKFKGNGKNGVINVVASLAMIAGFAYCLYNSPRVLLDGLTWIMVEQMGPTSLIVAVMCLAVLIPVFFIYFMLNYFFTKEDDKPYFMIIILSIVSGVGNSLIIFIINSALNRSMYQDARLIGIESGLYLYFLFGIAIFVAGTYVFRIRLNIITNTVIYDIRMKIIKKVLNASFYHFESLENGKVYATLNNDTETVSNGVNLMVNFSAGIVILVTCYIYLGALDLLAMALSLLIICLAVFLFIAVSKSAEKLFEKNRDYQNIFFRNINDLVNGFKELYINVKKRKGFHQEITKNCEVYKETRIEGENKFVSVTIFGSILYLVVIGIVVFIFPVFFDNLKNSTLRDYVTVYLYMGNIINQQIYLVPQAVRVLVSWRRIQSFVNDISGIDEEFAKEIYKEKKSDKIFIELKDVTFSYKHEKSEMYDNFTVGPIDYAFSSGEIVFISGGNGSGKSTLAKLITGLYLPDSGEILVNGIKASPRELSSYFTTVYSDFYLFDKLYGIDCAEKQDEIEKLLDLLRIRDKVQIENGSFSTLKLSTGQRKRLALLISYLEDKPIFLFDEWTADQDPEFRMFFYNVLLPGLKAKGKIVIAITHDDRYFDHADKLIKMETGKVVDNFEKCFEASSEVASVKN